MIIRGFLRNYAKLLEIDADPLVEQFKSIKPNISPKSLTLSSANIPISSKQNSDWQKYLGISVLIAIMVLAWLFYSDYQAKHLDDLNANTVGKVKSAIAPVVDQVVAPVAQAVNQTPISNSTNETVPVTSQSIAPAVNNTPSSPVKVAEIQAEPAPPAVNLAEVSKMRFKASESSWVHVLDANNKVILDAIVPARGEAFAEGKPPFNVVIGNAPVSTLEFNQNAIDLTPFTKGKVARLKLE